MEKEGFFSLLGSVILLSAVAWMVVMKMNPKSLCRQVNAQEYKCSYWGIKKFNVSKEFADKHLFGKGLMKNE
jgi:hypothetical protein